MPSTVPFASPSRANRRAAKRPEQAALAVRSGGWPKRSVALTPWPVTGLLFTDMVLNDDHVRCRSAGHHAGGVAAPRVHRDSFEERPRRWRCSPKEGVC